MISREINIRVKAILDVVSKVQGLSREDIEFTLAEYLADEEYTYFENYLVAYVFDKYQNDSYEFSRVASPYLDSYIDSFIAGTALLSIDCNTILDFIEYHKIDKKDIYALFRGVVWSTVEFEIFGDGVVLDCGGGPNKHIYQIEYNTLNASSIEYVYGSANNPDEPDDSEEALERMAEIWEGIKHDKNATIALNLIRIENVISTDESEFIEDYDIDKVIARMEHL